MGSGFNDPFPLRLREFSPLLLGERDPALPHLPQHTTNAGDDHEASSFQGVLLCPASEGLRRCPEQDTAVFILAPASTGDRKDVCK